MSSLLQAALSFDHWGSISQHVASVCLPLKVTKLIESLSMSFLVPTFFQEKNKSLVGSVDMGWVTCLPALGLRL